MSSENEGQQPGGAFGPTSQFNAFRARQADDRAQQEAEEAYAFPAEYAADPTVVFPARPPQRELPLLPVAPRPPGRFGGGRMRSVAIFASVVVAAGCVAFGAIEAFGSSGPSTTSSSASTPTTGAKATPAGGSNSDGSSKHAKTVTVRVIVESVAGDSFTGKLTSTGQTVTVLLTDKTRYGTAEHPFSKDELASGEVVLVRGRRTADDTLAATTVVGGQEGGSATATATDGGAA